MESFWLAVVHWWFWEGFWPNLAATAVGVAAGIPIARWIYHWQFRADARAAEKTRKSRSDEVIDILTDTLSSHVDAFRADAQPSGASVSVVSEVPVAVWESVKEEVFALVPRVTLRARLATHFEQVSRLIDAQEARADRILRRAGTAVLGPASNVQQNEDNVLRRLQEQTRSAEVEAMALMTELRMHRS